ncbi:MAG TPA: hypothetical protein VGP93_19170 [Polyangiaceae bacterium]|jgi:photosystem II stability/assembly factor-like uncharacterized protein|nr:hypothetical protein [Polyangiaceae bacterium]
MASDCISVGRVGAEPGSKRVIVGVALQSLFASDDSGQTWQALGTGGGSAPITNRASSITFDPEHADVFWETGTHNGGGMYRTSDGGETFVQLGTMTMSQDAAVDFADPDRKTLLTGTHGAGVYRSTDGGVSFASVGAALPGNTLWPLLIDSQTHLMGTYEQDAANANNGIYRTTDGGASWTRVSSLAPSHDGSLVRTSDDSIYLALSGNSGIAKSTDLGQTWAEVTGPTAAFAPPSFSINPVELPDGRLVTIGTDHLVISSDGGVTFEPFGEPLPYAPSGGEFGGLTYSVVSKTFFLWHSSCGANVVLDNAIMSAGFDYAAQ